MVICSSVFLSSKTLSAYDLKAPAWKPAQTYPWKLLRPSFPTPPHYTTADATLTDSTVSNTMAWGPGEGTENDSEHTGVFSLWLLSEALLSSSLGSKIQCA